MSTNKTTTQSTQAQQTSSGSQTQNSSWQNNYDPASLAAYHAMLPQWQSTVSGLMSNPMNNPWFNTALGMGRASIGQQGATQQQGLLSNLRQSGLSNSAAGQAMLARQSRATSGQQAGLFNGLAMNSMGLGMQALGMAGSYNPLVSGGSQTQSGNWSQTGNQTSHGQTVEQTGGLGSWLPQVAGAAIGGLTGGLGSSLGSSLFGGGKGQPGQSATTGGYAGTPYAGSIPQMPMQTNPGSQLMYNSPMAVNSGWGGTGQFNPFSSGGMFGTPYAGSLNPQSSNTNRFGPGY